jgi:hypothetical protein
MTIGGKMKFEIDLNEILGDEYGNMESLADRIIKNISLNVLKKPGSNLKNCYYVR